MIFRNPDFLWDEVVNTVIIGDSFVEGQCVDYENSIGGVFNKNNIKTINLASGGNSSIYYAALSKIYLNVLKPKNVILIFHENDNSLVESTELITQFYKSLKPNDFVNNHDGKLKASKKVEKFNQEIMNYLNVFRQ